MKKILIFILVLIFSFLSVSCSENNNGKNNVNQEKINNNQEIQNKKVENKKIETKKEEEKVKIKNQQQEKKEVKKVKKFCKWIDESDVIIQLDLPEKYAHYNDRTIFPSYNLGYMSKDKYGMVYRSFRMARKQCDYRVGFNKKDFENIKSGDTKAPIVIAGEAGKGKMFTYENSPIFLTIKDGLPKQGKKFILKVTGEINDSDFINPIFKH